MSFLHHYRHQGKKQHWRGVSIVSMFKVGITRLRALILVSSFYRLVKFSKIVARKSCRVAFLGTGW